MVSVVPVLSGDMPKQETIQMDATTRMKCSICGHIYDPKKGDEGAAPGTAFANLPDDWCCPVCGAAKTKFSEVN